MFSDSRVSRTLIYPVLPCTALYRAEQGAGLSRARAGRPAQPGPAIMGVFSTTGGHYSKRFAVPRPVGARPAVLP